MENKDTREKQGGRASLIGILANFLLSGIKLAAGLISASVAITADALNNLSDAGASAITLVSFKMAAKPADRDHPFGHARMEYVTSMVVAFLVLHTALDLVFESIGDFQNPENAKEKYDIVGGLIYEDVMKQNNIILQFFVYFFQF